MSLQHFLELASAGRHDTASSGEKACQRIAKTLMVLLDDLASIDLEAHAGASEAMRMSYLPATKQALMEATRPLPVIPLEDRDNE